MFVYLWCTCHFVRINRVFQFFISSNMVHHIETNRKSTNRKLIDSIHFSNYIYSYNIYRIHNMDQLNDDIYVVWKRYHVFICAIAISYIWIFFHHCRCVCIWNSNLIEVLVSESTYFIQNPFSISLCSLLVWPKQNVFILSIKCCQIACRIVEYVIENRFLAISNY